MVTFISYLATCLAVAVVLSIANKLMNKSVVGKKYFNFLLTTVTVVLAYLAITTS